MTKKNSELARIASWAEEIAAAWLEISRLRLPGESLQVSLPGELAAKVAKEKLARQEAAEVAYSAVAGSVGSESVVYVENGGIKRRASDLAEVGEKSLAEEAGSAVVGEAWSAGEEMLADVVSGGDIAEDIAENAGDGRLAAQRFEEKLPEESAAVAVQRASAFGVGGSLAKERANESDKVSLSSGELRASRVAEGIAGMPDWLEVGNDLAGGGSLVSERSKVTVSDLAGRAGYGDGAFGQSRSVEIGSVEMDRICEEVAERLCESIEIYVQTAGVAAGSV